MNAISTRTERTLLIDIEVPINYAGTTINIPDQPMLRDKRVTRIDTYIVTDMPKSFISGNPVATQNQLSFAALTGYIADPQNEHDNGEFIYRQPLTDFRHIQNGNYTQNVIVYDDLKLQWDKCQIQLSQAINPTATFSYVLNVHYTSRKNRIFQALHKAISGVSEETMADMLMRKIMQLEEMLKRLTSGKRD